VSLGYAKSITRQATTPCTAEQPLEQSQPELQDPSGPHPYPHPTFPVPPTPPTSVARCLGVFQFDMLDRFSLISSAGQRCQHRQSAAVVIVSLRCACRRQFIAFLL